MLTSTIIFELACDYYKQNPTTVSKKTRKREYVQTRQIAMFLSKNLTKESLANIGRNIGDKDHATVLHACKTVKNLIDTDKQVFIDVMEIEKLCYSYVPFEIKNSFHYKSYYCFDKKEKRRIMFKLKNKNHVKRF